MRLAGTLAIPLWLAFAAAASVHQDAAGTATVAAQAATAPVSAASLPSEQTPADATPAADRRTEGSAENKQSASGAVGAKKRRKRPTPPSPGVPKRIVVREGGANEPAEQIVPGMTPSEAVHERENTEQWLSSTDAQVRQLGEGNLTSQRQETLGQIRNYMNGARAALKEGDVRRAGTLAEKAHLLADDLLKH